MGEDLAAQGENVWRIFEDLKFLFWPSSPVLTGFSRFQAVIFPFSGRPLQTPGLRSEVLSLEGYLTTLASSRIPFWIRCSHIIAFKMWGDYFGLRFRWGHGKKEKTFVAGKCKQPENIYSKSSGVLKAGTMSRGPGQITLRGSTSLAAVFDL